MAGVKSAVVDKLQVYLCESRKDMADYAGKDVIEKIKELDKEKDMINIMFAAAPSQNEFLENLLADTSIPWEKINVFHMDEYLGNHEFVTFLRDRLFDKVDVKEMFLLNGCCADADAECRRYADILKHTDMDIVCMGIGENGHIAFNDPHVADFEDPETVKIVELDERCRMQQVNDKCFASINKVPRQAITVTIPALIHAKRIYCIVPGDAKAEAVKRTLQEGVSEACPASILRKLDYASLYLDSDSGKYVKDSGIWKI